MDINYNESMPLTIGLYMDISELIVNIYAVVRQSLKRFSIWYRKVYVHVSTFSIALLVLLYNFRQCIYKLPLSYTNICEIYACALLLALSATSLCLYARASLKLIVAQTRALNLATESALHCFDLYRLEEQKMQQGLK